MQKIWRVFFSVFEHLADAQGWFASTRRLMLQCMLTGKVQEIYLYLSDTDCLRYFIVKSAVFKAYEFVSEAYRQHFRTWRH